MSKLPIVTSEARVKVQQRHVANISRGMNYLVEEIARIKETSPVVAGFLENLAKAGGLQMAQGPLLVYLLIEEQVRQTPGSRLPTVTTLTRDVISEGYEEKSKTGFEYIDGVMKRLEDDNPLIAEIISRAALRTGEEFSFVHGPLLLYEMLEAQGAVDQCPPIPGVHKRE